MLKICFSCFKKQLTQEEIEKKRLEILPFNWKYKKK